MMALQARSLSFAYEGAAPLFDRADLHLAPGWYGLDGANGAGKSTLLRLLAEPCPRTGGACSSSRRARGWRSARRRSRPRAMRCCGWRRWTKPGRGRSAGGWRSIRRHSGGWPSLSPGERKRWQIGAALAEEPDVLLLDEPTNHLDAEARALLVGALERFRGIGVVVSHDRSLLDALTTATIRIHGAAVTRYPGGYGDARCSGKRRRASGTRRTGAPGITTGRRRSASRTPGGPARRRSGASPPATG